MNTLRKKVSKADLFSEYTKILNGVLGLSKREAEVFSFLLEKDSDNSPEYMAYRDKNINSKFIRDELINKYSISEANLSRYLRTIKDKGLIVKVSNGWVINDIVRLVIKDNVFELKFVLEIE